MQTRKLNKQQALSKLVETLRLQRKAISTERCYTQWVGSYIEWLKKHGLGLPDSHARFEAYLTHLANRRVSASTQNQAFNAINYFYRMVLKEEIKNVRALRAKQSQHHRTALSRADTLNLLERVTDRSGYPTRLVARLLYGCGLRVSEPLNLRVKDVDVANSRLIIRGAKGGKDRTVSVPCSLMAEIKNQIKAAKTVWERDRADRMPVEVPGHLARKYPGAPFSWQWAWVFPSHTTCQHPRTGEPVRYRMHEANVQRAVKEAAKQLDLDSLATPHVLRHCWATHVIDAGANIKDVQEHLGHKSLETTMVYVKPDQSRIPTLL